MQLVARAHVDAVPEIAAADARGPGLQHLDRAPDLARERETGDHRDEHAQQHEQPCSQDGAAHRRERLDQRLLDEDGPAEWRDDGVRHQRAAAGKIGGQHRVLGPVARGAHVRLRREIGLAQHEADVGMRDEVPLPINHVGLAQATHADLRDDVPDELEVDLGRGDRRRGGGAVGHGERHVRLRVLAEVHGPVPDASAARLAEARLAGDVGAAGHLVHGQPGDAQLLAPAPVEEGDLGDGGHLAL